MPYYPNYYQPTMQQQVAPVQIPQQQSVAHTNDFVPVPSENVARNYPVAPGTSVNFKNENAPYIYTKTMGFSQFDQPIFKKYRLIEEEDDNRKTKEEATDIYDEINKIWDKINDIEKTVASREEDDGV